LAGIEKIKRHEKAKATNLILAPRFGSKDYILLEHADARTCPWEAATRLPHHQKE
jgi:hypothetical protein